MLRLLTLILVILLISFTWPIFAQDDFSDSEDRWIAVRKAVCLRKPKYGKCGGHRKMWYFDSYKMECQTFVYSNCGGNRNRFYFKEECDDFCTSKAEQWAGKKV